MSPNLIQTNDEIVDEDFEQVVEIEDNTNHINQQSINEMENHSARFNSSTNSRLTFSEYYILFIQGQLRSPEYIEYYNIPRFMPSNSPYNHVKIMLDHARSYYIMLDICL